MMEDEENTTLRNFDNLEEKIIDKSGPLLLGFKTTTTKTRNQRR